MELIKSTLLEVSIIEKTGKRMYLDPNKIPLNLMTDKTRNAIKRNAEIRWYYKPKTSFEIIKTAIPPRYEQPWHSHHKLFEAMLVLKGQVVTSEERGGKVIDELLSEGDFVVFDRNKGTYHTMKNIGQDYAYTLTYKFLSPATKDEQLFRSDWHGK